MKKRFCILCAGLLLAGMLTGCTKPAPSAPTATPAATATPAPTAAPAPTATATPVPSPVPNLQDSDFGQESSDLSFLTEEQQDLYYKALKFRLAFFSLPDNIQQFPQFQPLAENNWVVIQDGYSLYQNSYEEFSNLAHSVFTQDYLDSLGPLYTEKFVDRDGRLATSTDRGLTRDSLPGARRPVLENYPDLFRLEYQDEETIEFTLISHYDRNWQNYTGEDGMDIYTAEYPIRMINTDDGWRIDEFHTTEYG